MFSFDAELPVKCNPYPDESGYGFCLRTAHRNGTNLHALRRILSLNEVQGLYKSQALALSKLFGTAPEWFTSTLKDSPLGRSRSQGFWGHTIYLASHLRWKHPQVCPVCIHRHGYCRAIWDLSLSTVCLEHGCLLVDSCEQCGESLRWSRPSVDVGHCKHYIQAAKVKTELPDSAFDLQFLLEQKFLSDIETGKRQLPETRVAPNFLGNSSLGAVLIYLTAFGAKKSLFDRDLTQISKQSLPTARWREIALRGWDRCQSFDALSQPSVVDADLVLWKLILRLLTNDANPDDARLAADVVRSLHPGELPHEILRNALVLRQRVLF